MNDPWKTISAHVIGSLPDSIEQRRRLLNALCRVMPAQAPAADEVAEVLFHLNRHNLAQREFPFRLGDTDLVTIREGAPAPVGEPIPPRPATELPRKRRNGGAR
ncbi:MAG: hypothetical protein KIT22_15320 [Verrucomicrobiae bacterium]|nr:hypothetical protein [Verrucomicrobiae bacterium]